MTPRILIVGTLLLGFFLAPMAQAQQPKPPAASGVSAEAKAKAKEHFLAGLELFNRGVWEAALAEFLRSRALYATRSNTQNAAVALAKLNRFDEALDMFEALLEEFPDLPDRAKVGQEVKRLRALVGSVEIRLATPGATVVIDGRNRGKTPLAGPLRVSSGSHVVRVFLGGMAPYEVRIEVAGGEKKVVEPVLTTLTRAGRLKVTEQRGATAEVLVDGIVVGKTPWEGALEPGSHAVALRGEGKRGTQPVRAPVKLDETTVLNLALESLDCSLRIDPQPLSASVAIDGVEVGRGTWEGPLRCGRHRVEVAAKGFLPANKRISLTADRAVSENIELERDPASELWRAANPPRVFVEANLGALAAVSFGGDVWDGCSGSCEKALPFGVAATVYGGYQLSSGIGVGIGVGYLAVRTNINQRDVVPLQVPSSSPLSGVESDRLTLSGLTLGIAASLQRGKDWPWTVRLGGGVLLGRLEDRRSATVEFGSGSSGYGPRTDRVSARYAYVAPEFRIGPRFGKFELSAGIRPMLLLALSQPEFDDKQRLTDDQSLGYFRFQPETLSASTMALIEAGLGVRYSFY